MKMIAVMTCFQTVPVSRWQLLTVFAGGAGSSTGVLPGAHMWRPFWLWRGSSPRLLRRSHRRTRFGCIVSARRDYLYSPHCFMYRIYPSVQVVITNTIDTVLGGLNVRPLLLTVLESGKSQIEAPAGLVTGESHFLTDSSQGSFLGSLL